MNFTILHLVRKDKKNRGEKPQKEKFMAKSETKQTKRSGACHCDETKTSKTTKSRAKKSGGEMTDCKNCK